MLHTCIYHKQDGQNLSLSKKYQIRDYIQDIKAVQSLIILD